MSKPPSASSILQDDEEMLFELAPVRTSNALWFYLLCLFFLVSAGTYLTIILDPAVATGVVTLGMFLLGLGGVVLILLYVERIVRGYRYYLTDRQIVEEVDFLTTTTTSRSCDSIESIDLDQGIVDGFFGTGSITVEVAADDEPGMTLRWIENAAEVERILAEHVGEEA